MKPISRQPYVGIILVLMSLTTLAVAGVEEMILPSPETTGQWSFYGVLIAAIIVLGLAIAMILKWVASKWLEAQKKTDTVMENMTIALTQFTEELRRHNKWFEDTAKSFIQHGMEHAHMSFRHRREED